MIEMYNNTHAEGFLRLATAMHQESSFKDVPFDVGAVAALPLEAGVFCVVDVREGLMVGFFLGHICRYFFSQAKASYDLAFYVTPEFRGSSSVVQLINAYETWAKSRGVKQIYLGQSTGVDMEKTDRLFNRLGYTKLGSTVVKEI